MEISFSDRNPLNIHHSFDFSINLRQNETLGSFITLDLRRPSSAVFDRIEHDFLFEFNV